AAPEASPHRVYPAGGPRLSSGCGVTRPLHSSPEPRHSGDCTLAWTRRATDVRSGTMVTQFTPGPRASESAKSERGLLWEVRAGVVRTTHHPPGAAGKWRRGARFRRGFAAGRYYSAGQRPEADVSDANRLAALVRRMNPGCSDVPDAELL